MGTTKSRKSRRNNSRPAAFTFLSNITLGSENDQQVNHVNVISQNHESLHATESLYTIVSPNANDTRHRKDHDQGGSSSSHDGHSPTEIKAVSLLSTDSNISADSLDVQTPLRGERNNRALQTLATTPSIMTPVGTGATSTFLLNAQLDQKKVQEHQQQQQQQPQPQQQRRPWSLEINNDDDVWHHKLTREDSERPIASEKIKKKAQHTEKEHVHEGLGIMSVVRYYTEKIKLTAGKKSPHQPTNHGYLQQQLARNDSHRRRHALSYAHFLSPSHSLDSDYEGDTSTYNPYFLDNDSYNRFGLLVGSQGTGGGQALRPSELKRELNEQFHRTHPEIPGEITMSKIRSIKSHLLEIGKAVDLEISSLAHAFVYFEKLVIKNVVTKRNRKLIAACCLFLATKVNEAKGAWFEPLFEAIDDELDVDSKEVREHEFAVFADLEFNLYIRQMEFMPHFDRILYELEYNSIEEYLGNTEFYKVAK